MCNCNYLMPRRTYAASSRGRIRPLPYSKVLRFGRCVFFFSSRRRHTRYWRDWSSDVCSSDLAGGPLKTPAPPRPKPSRKRRASEPDAMSLAWLESQYQKAFPKLNEAIKAQAPLPPSLRVEYEYNLALIDNAIITTRQIARKNPQDPLATQFMLAAYQSKIDLMNQF